MAIPKTLREIETGTALKTIDKHLKAGTGKWEGSPGYSDFVYGHGSNLTLIRPPAWAGGKYETGRVSM